MECCPEPRVERDAGRERGDLGEEPIVNFAEGGGVVNGVDVLDFAPGEAELAGGLLKREKSVCEAEMFARLRCDGLDGRGGVAEGNGDASGDGLGCELAPADVKFGVEKWMRGGGHESVCPTGRG